jgi:hypothetical protein
MVAGDGLVGRLVSVAAVAEPIGVLFEQALTAAARPTPPARPNS